MERSNKQFLNNSIITLSRQFASIIIGILLLVIIARVLGRTGQGYYTLITLLPLMLQTFLNLGINSSTIYYVSKREVDLNTAFNTNVLTGFLLSLISIIIGVFAIFLLSSTKFQGLDLSTLYLVLSALPFMFLMIFLQTLFQGMENFKIFNFMLVIQQTGNLLVLTILLFIFNMELNGVIIAFISGYVFAVIYAMYILLAKYKVQISLKFFSWTYFKKSYNYGLKTHTSNVLAFLNYRTPILLLGLLLNPASVAIYAVATNIGERLSIFSQSISSVLLPRVASMKEELARNQITSLVSRNMLLFITIVSLTVFFSSNFIIGTFFGNDYIESAAVLNILLPGLAFLSIEKLLSNDLAARGKPEINMYVSFSNVVINVTLNLSLIPLYGIRGAAIATSITYIFSFFVKVFVFSRITNQHFYKFLLINKSDFKMYSRMFSLVKKKLKIS